MNTCSTKYLCRGSTVRCAASTGDKSCTPAALPLEDLSAVIDTHQLAEAAIFEGLHLRSYDWSIFPATCLHSHRQLWCVAVGGTEADSSSARAATTRAFVYMAAEISLPIMLLIDSLLFLLTAQHHFGNAASSEADAGCAQQLMHSTLKFLSRSRDGQTDGQYDNAAAASVGSSATRSIPHGSFAFKDMAAAARRQGQWRSFVQGCESAEACSSIYGTTIQSVYPQLLQAVGQTSGILHACAGLRQLLAACGNAANLSQLWAALLHEKRVVFVSPSGCAASSLTMLVYAACWLLGDEGARGAQRRCKPLLALSDTSWTQCAGLIGGSNNPLIKSKTSWWDVCVDVEKATVLCADASSAACEHVQQQLLPPAAQELFAAIDSDPRILYGSVNAFVLPFQLRAGYLNMAHARKAAVCEGGGGSQPPDTQQGQREAAVCGGGGGSQPPDTQQAQCRQTPTQVAFPESRLGLACTELLQAAGLHSVGAPALLRGMERVQAATTQPGILLPQSDAGVALSRTFTLLAALHRHVDLEVQTASRDCSSALAACLTALGSLTKLQ